MTKKKTLLFTAFVLASTLTYSQEAPLRLTLEDCIDLALGDNYSRRAVKLNEDSQQASVMLARSERLPTLTANIGENYNYSDAAGNSWSGSYDLSTNVVVYQGGQVSNTVKLNEQQLEQTRLQTRQYDNVLTIEVLQAFLAVIGNEELLKYQRAVAEASRQQAIEGKIKYEAGQILESDYLLLEAQYASDSNNIATTQITVENSLVALKNLMSMDLARPVELIYPDDAALESMLSMPGREEVLVRGMESLPEIRISDYNVEIAETGLRLSKSSYYPTVSLNAAVGTGHAQDFSNYGRQLSDRFGPSAGVSLNIPIFNRNRTKTNVIQSRIALQQAELDRKQSILDVEQTLINEYGNVTASAGSYVASTISRDAYESSFEAYRQMYGAGAITTVELLQQQNNYISAMNDYIQRKYSFMLQRKILDVYMGVPVMM